MPEPKCPKRGDVSPLPLERRDTTARFQEREERTERVLGELQRGMISARRSGRAKTSGSNKAQVELNPGGIAVRLRRLGGPMEAAPRPLHRFKRTFISLGFEVQSHLRGRRPTAR